MNELREQGIAAAKAGRRDEARTLLARALQHNAHDEHAWLWLAGVLDAPADIRHCLDRALALNPHSERAQQGLRWLDERYGARTPTNTAPPEQASSEREAISEKASRAEPIPAIVADVSESAIVPAPTPYVPEMPFATPAAIEQPSLLLPCPYCGAPTFLTRERCLKCGKSLMVRGAVPQERSSATTLLGVLWILNGVFVLLGGVLALGLTLFLFTTIQSASGARNATSSFVILLPAIIIVLVGGFQLYVARALFRRERWAYYVVIALSILSMFSIIYNVARGFVFARVIRLSLGAASQRLNAVSTFTVVLSLFGFALQIAYFVLVWHSYGDFFGAQQRFVLAVEPRDDANTHYNKGLAYQRTGMWYAAAHEWETALNFAPNDIKYLHALGLAYAQLKRPDEARATLDQAIALAPDDQRLRDSRAFVDTLAGEPPRTTTDE